MSDKFSNQTEVVVNALMRNKGVKRSEALEIWLNSTTKRILMDERNMTYLSGARCYDELEMEITGNPYWLKGQFN